MLKQANFSGVNKTLLFLFLLVSVFTAGCRTATDAAPANQSGTREYVNKNGLIVKLPDNLTARENGDGFLIEPSADSDKNLRFPVEIIVELHNGGVNPPGDLNEQESIGGKTVKYRVEKAPGGSNGAEYTLTAVEMIDGGYISYRTTEQDKNSQPDFKTVWQIIENTSLKN